MEGRHEATDGTVDFHQEHEGTHTEQATGAHELLCDLCGKVLTNGHRRLVDLATNLVREACADCDHAVLPRGNHSLRYRVVPERYVRLPRGIVKSGRWDALRIPVALAFLVHRSAHHEYVAYYPSADGPLVETLTPEQWADLMHGEPLLESLESDVEALLVDGRGVAPSGFIVPITAYFELDRRLGDDWQGYDGGPRAAGIVDAFLMSVGCNFQTRD